MDAATVERLKAEGWPWDRLAEAVFARIDAGRFADAVLEDASASTEDRHAAASELNSALLTERFARGELADVFLLLLRSAVEERPDELFGLVMAAADEVTWKEVVAWLANSKPGGAEQWLATSRRLAAIEEQVTKLKAENWELANWIARLEREHGPQPTGVAHGDREAGEGAAGANGPPAGGSGGRRDAG